MGHWSIHRILLAFTLALCVSSAPQAGLRPPVRVQCYSNPHILQRPLKISNATVISNTTVLVSVGQGRRGGFFNKIICGPLYPKLIPCPFDESPRNAKISWQFCPEGKLTNHCEDRPARSFYTFLLIAGLRKGDQGTYYCKAVSQDRTFYERWEVRHVHSNWDLIWTNNSLKGFYAQLSRSGELQRFEEKLIEN